MGFGAGIDGGGGSLGVTVSIDELEAPAADGAVIVGDGSGAPQEKTLLTGVNGTVRHEMGGLEADVSAASGIPKISGGSTTIVAAPSGALVGTSDSQALTNKTIVAGSNTISGITEAMLTLADNTTGNASASAHGFVPKLPNTGTQFYRDDGTFAAPAGGGDALTSDGLDQFAATSSAELRGVISDESGDGALLFQNGALGTPASGTLTNCTGLPTAGLVDAAVTYAKIQNVSATDKILGRSTAGAGVVEEIPCTSAGRALLDDADASAQRTTLGLGTIATQAANNVSITGGAISGITDLPVADGGTGASTAAGARTNLGVVDFYKAALGTGVHGATTISADTTLTADLYCTTLTVDVTKVLTTGNYIIHATGAVTVNGTIRNNGAAGGAGGNGSGPSPGGAPGTAASPGSAGSLGASAQGGGGGTGDDGGILGGGSQGQSAGGGILALGGSSGTNGGAGGAGTSSAGGGAGTATAATVALLPASLRYRWPESSAGGTLMPSGGVGGSGGGGGGAVVTEAGGGGGAGGNGGGIVMIFCGGTLTVGASGTIEAKGGAGGAGGTGGAGAGGGGGGGGGDGGYIQLVYGALANSGSITAAGGAAGAAGTGGANNGTNGTAGTQGAITKFNLTSGAYE